MKQKILITSALPYANGPLHFGHIAGAYLPADSYARFERLQGNDVLYICGSDEHGVAITLSAELAGRSPQEHVDHFHKKIQDFFQTLEFSFDYYSRTTSARHAEVTRAFYEVLREKGFIEEREEEHLFSEKENRFLADRYVVGTCPKCGYEEARGDECPRCAHFYEATELKCPRSKLSGSPLILKPSRHLYLRFDRFKEALSGWIEKKPWKENVLHFAKKYIEELKPRAITRDSSWGVPVPGCPGKVFYVWFDAPIGYLSATQEWAQKIGDPERWEEYWLDPETRFVQFIGKDNIPFHAVFFPAMLMGQDLPYKLPDEIPANEFFLLEGRQFSKSDGWSIDLEEFFRHYTPDQARYALAANAPETADAQFSWKDFQMRCNAELLGKLGNFVHRVLVFCKTHFSSQVPSSDLQEEDRAFLEQIQLLVEQAADCYRHFHLRKACQTLMDLAQKGNGYFDAKKPWICVKDLKTKASAATTVACCIEAIKNLCLIASPLIPQTAQKVWEMLGFSSQLEKEHWEELQKRNLPEGHKIQEPYPLFRKIEDEEIERQILALDHMRSQKKEPSMTVAPLPPLKETISFADFEKMDLRVGKILSAERIEKSKKLLKLRIDMGLEERTVVSGISLFYEPADLEGKKVILVANLAPAKIMGVESCGMVLAGAHESQLELAHIQDLPVGACVS